MNKNLKFILIFINAVMSILSIFWYLEKKELEPAIVFFGQISTLIGLFFEKKASKIFTKEIDNDSDVKVDVKTGDHVKTTKISKSKVSIKTRD